MKAPISTATLAMMNDILGSFGMRVTAEKSIFNVEDSVEVKVTITDGNSGSAAPVIEAAIEKFGSVAYAIAISNLMNKTFLSAEECRHAVLLALKGMLEACGNSMSENARTELAMEVISLAR